jgi:hypothetical protein
MIRFRRSVRSQRGVALLAVMLALLVLSLIVSAMVFMTMGESTMSFGNLHNQQALAAAEGGAYRMLAELRHRVEVDLSAHVGGSTVASEDLHAICRAHLGRQRINIFTDYGYPGGSSDWRQSGTTAILDLGTAASPIVMSDSSTGTEIASFNATLYIRWSERSELDEDCVGTGDDPRFVMWFDYAIVSTGRVANAVKTVCLHNQGADRCADWVSASGWHGSTAGFPILIQREPVSRYAAMTLSVGPVWFSTGAVLNGRVHSNSQIRIAGNPTFNAPVTQGDPSMHFYACGAGLDIPIDTATPPRDPNSYLRVGPSCDLPTFNSTVTSGVVITLPSDGTNPARAALGMTPLGGADPAGADVRSASNDDAYAAGALRDGVYVMDACGASSCGIYVQGDVQQMVLRSENGKQVILLTIGTSWDSAQRNQKIIVDPATGTVQRCWMLSGSDPGTGDCAGWASTRSYVGLTFNGVLFINGSITSDSDPGGSSGLYGMVNRNTRLTLAADREIRITDHLIYETPPAAPGHNPTNVLGLWSRNGNVTIVGALTPNDVYIDAAVMVPNGMFWVEGWNVPPARGNVYFLGSTLQQTFGPFGGFAPETGYGRVMGFDWRLASDVMPPYTLRSSMFASMRSSSTASIFSGGDPLYDRPQWEELIGI